MSTPTTPCRLCLIGERTHEPCTQGRCGFWESGCVLDRLGHEVREPAVARYLLGTRRRLDALRRDEAEAAHLEFARRLGREL